MSELDELRRRVQALEAQVALLAGALMPAQRREPERCAFERFRQIGNPGYPGHVPLGLVCTCSRCRPYSIAGGAIQ